MIITLRDTDSIELVTDAAATVDVIASYTDHTLSTDNYESDTQLTAISTATTTVILSAPASGVRRGLKFLSVRNRDASVTVTVTVQVDRSTANYQSHAAILKPGECLEFAESIGFYPLKSAALDRLLRVTSNVVNATTSFADVTGLSAPVESGKFYSFIAVLSHETNATTTGARFGANGPAATAFWIAQVVSGQTPGIASTNIAIGNATAYDTACAASTTGPGTTRTSALLSGYLNPSANGTFAIRCASEVAVASGLTIHAGSWMSIRELSN